MNVLVADRTGQLLYCTGSSFESVQLRPAHRLPETLVEGIALGTLETPSRMELSIFTSSVLVHAVGVYNDSNELCGIVAVTSQHHGWGDMVEELTRTVIIAAMVVIAATMIAVYIISVRTTEPLRQMSSAARRMADGDFDVRINVRGRDEVAELATAFNQMADSLETLEKMRNSFIANVSHDLRTPMTTIAGFIDGIRDGVIPPEQRDHYLEVIAVEVRRLSRLVTSLLDLSRLQAGDRKLTMRPVDICEMGRIILISFEQQIDAKELEVSFSCAQDRILVMADHDALYQVFYNLCHNAIKFSKTGGLLRITIDYFEEHRVMVSVYNEGEGIAEEDLPYVFERFYKSDKSRGLDKNGAGLGLFISKTIIKAHGEEIGVRGEHGRYCEFFFYLPVASDKTKNQISDKPNDALTRRKK